MLSELADSLDGIHAAGEGSNHFFLRKAFLAMWPSNRTPDGLSQRNENFSSNQIWMRMFRDTIETTTLISLIEKSRKQAHPYIPWTTTQQ